MSDDPASIPGPTNPDLRPPGVVDPYEVCRGDAQLLSDRLGDHDVAIVLGSGWAGVGDMLGTVETEMEMSALAGVPTPRVAGHGGTARSVRVDVSDGGHRRVLLLAGRSHLYEGHSPSTVVHAVRTAVLHGCRGVVLTNAAGSLRADVAIGSAVLISDQLNLTGSNPMCGDEPPAEFGSRFTDLSDLYTSSLRRAVLELHPGLVEGVYAGVLGGSYETPAEITMLRTLGADLVGMSTVLEAIAAHHLGAHVLGVSLVTNLAAGLQETLAHGDVLAAGAASTETLVGVLRAAVTIA